MHQGLNQQCLHMRFFLLSAILTCVLTACGQELKQPAYSPSTPLPHVKNKMIPTPATTSVATSSGNIVNSTIVDGIAYAGTLNQDVYALHINNGSLLWHKRVEGSVEELPLIEHGIVYISSFIGQNGPAYLSALRASDGTLLWRYRSNSYIYQPVVNNNLVYIAEQGNGLSALQTRNGTQVWHVAGTTTQSPFLLNDILYLNMSVASQPDGVYALRAENGSMMWNYPTSVSDTLLLQEGVIYTCCSQETISALSMRDGHPIWKQKIVSNSFAQTPQIVAGVLYLMATQAILDTPTVTNFQLFPPILAVSALLENTNQSSTMQPQKAGKAFIYAIRISDGAILWQKNLLGGSNSFASWFQVQQDTLYASVISVARSNSTVLMALRTSNGQTIWQNMLQGDPVGSVLNAGILYSIGSADQSALYALSMQDGTLLWSTGITGRVLDQPILINKQLSINADNGVIYALSADNGTLLWYYQTGTGS